MWLVEHLSDCTSSKTDSDIVIIVRELELKFNATQVEIDDTRFLSCLPVAPFAMEATLFLNLILNEKVYKEYSWMLDFNVSHFKKCLCP